MFNRNKQINTSRQGRPKSQQFPIYPRLLIITEGQTEVAYFNSFKRRQGPILVVESGQPDPVRLVKLAQARRQDLEVDQTWIVFDRDKRTNDTKQKARFSQGLAKAEDNQINCAYSNDCFELWLLLHFQDVSSDLDRKTIKSKLAKHFSKKFKINYQATKADKTIYAQLQPLTQVAIKRAKQLDRKHQQTPAVDANPSTTVYKLVEKLIDS